MTIKFGFELEGFVVSATSPQVVVVPPKGIPTDDFPGLVELRTVGGHSFFDAFGKLYAVYQRTRLDLKKLQPDLELDFELSRHKFTGDDLTKLRTLGQTKSPQTYHNLYSKKPVNTRGYTLASFQINFSKVLREAYKHPVTGIEVPPEYGLLNIPRIISRLDEAFHDELKDSRRDAGWYALKDNYTRLEYRSLPSCIGYDLLQSNNKSSEIVKKILHSVD